MVNAGRILIMPKGDWNSLTTYDMLDLVAYNGVAYLARQTNVGQNPSTDTSMTYWQPFGTASAIATTTTPGLVMPDGETITIDNTGLINVNIDNNTLVYDSVNGYLKADVVSALANLTDVNIASASNGQALVYDSSSSKWENASIPTGVKGDAESTYRTGSVNITKANIGLGNVSNPVILTDTLSIGSTSVTFTNAAIGNNSLIDVYTDVYGVNPTAMSQSSTTLTLTFDAQTVAVSVKVVVRN